MHCHGPKDFEVGDEKEVHLLQILDNHSREMSFWRNFYSYSYQIFLWLRGKKGRRSNMKKTPKIIFLTYIYINKNKNIHFFGAW